MNNVLQYLKVNRCQLPDSVLLLSTYKLFKTLVHNIFEQKLILTIVKNITGYLFCFCLTIVQMSGLKQENIMRRSPACFKTVSKTCNGNKFILVLMTVRASRWARQKFGVNVLE